MSPRERKKKLVAAFIVLLFAALMLYLLAGCGDDFEPKPKPEEPVEQCQPCGASPGECLGDMTARTCEWTSKYGLPQQKCWGEEQCAVGTRCVQTGCY